MSSGGADASWQALGEVGGWADGRQVGLSRWDNSPLFLFGARWQQGSRPFLGPVSPGWNFSPRLRGEEERQTCCGLPAGEEHPVTDPHHSQGS